MKVTKLALVLLLGALLMAGFACGGKYVPLLSDYPRLFKEDTMIIRNGAQYVYTDAEMIAAKLEELTGNAIIIRNDKDVSEEDKKAYNLILVEEPHAKSVIGQVYNTTNATKVTFDYPGECKAILEILPNPWDKNKVLLTVAGYDEWGMEAATTMLTNDSKIKELNGNLMVVASSYTRTRTMPSGFVDILVSPGDIVAYVGEEVVISYSVWPRINTPVDLTSVEVAFLDSNESLIRKQAMNPVDWWSFNTTYTIKGDEAFYRPTINFSINNMTENYSEYTDTTFNIVSLTNISSNEERPPKIASTLWQLYLANKENSERAEYVANMSGIQLIDGKVLVNVSVNYDHFVTVHKLIEELNGEILVEARSLDCIEAIIPISQLTILDNSDDVRFISLPVKAPPQ